MCTVVDEKREAALDKVRAFKKHLIELYKCSSYYDLKLHLGKDLILKKVMNHLTKEERILVTSKPVILPDVEEFGLADRLTFGKHKGSTVATVLREKPSYLRWVLKNTSHKFKLEIHELL